MPRATLLAAAIASCAPSVIIAAPGPPGPKLEPITMEEARSIVTGLFGLRARDPAAGDRSIDFEIDGYFRAVKCPLEGIRETRCGSFAWIPSSVRVFTRSFVAPVSGRLARNRIVVVDMFSDSAGVSSSSLHGVLVFPGPAVRSKRAPAFAWYLTRLGRTVSVDFADVTGDGALDLVYGYVQRFGGALEVVALDVWTLKGMKPEKILSSGEKLSGVFVSTFDGVALHDYGGDSLGRGSLRILRTGRGRPCVLVFEKGRIAGALTTWEVHVIARLDDGWDEYLTGAPEESVGGGAQVEVEGEPGADCSPVDVLPGLSVESRRVLLEVEASCRAVRASGSIDIGTGESPLLRALGMLAAAKEARFSGMSSVASALVESASISMSGAGASAWPWSMPLSFLAAVSAHRSYCRAFDPAFADCPERLADTLWYFPAFDPILLPVEWSLKAARRLLGPRFGRTARNDLVLPLRTTSAD